MLTEESRLNAMYVTAFESRLLILGACLRQVLVRILNCQDLFHFQFIFQFKNLNFRLTSTTYHKVQR